MRVGKVMSCSIKDHLWVESFVIYLTGLYEERRLESRNSGVYIATSDENSQESVLKMNVDPRSDTWEREDEHSAEGLVNRCQR